MIGWSFSDEQFFSPTGEGRSRRLTTASANSALGKFYILAVCAGLLCALLLIDAARPGGWVAGIGYAAVVALGASLGRKALYFLAIVTTLLAVVGFLVSPASRGVELPGSLLDLLFAIATIWIVSIALLQQISLRRHARDSAAALQSLFDQNPMMLAIHDREDRFLAVNRSYERKTGFSRSELIGKQRADVYRKLQIDMRNTKVLESVWTTGQNAQTGPFCAVIDGRTCWLLKTAFPISDADGKVVALGTATTDITDAWVAREQLAERQKRLEQSARDETIGMLAGGIAHDFNNVLGVIKGFACLLLEDIPEADIHHDYAQRILNVCQRGRVISQQITAYANSNDRPPQLVDLGKLAGDCTELVEGLMSSTTQFRLQVDGDDNLVFGDEAQLTQLIINLCNNANAAVEGGRGRVSLWVRRVLAPPDMDEMDGSGGMILGADLKSEPVVCITVTDDGAGIEKGELEKIFQPFYTKSKGRHGTGLGLAVVSRVVQAHGGRLVVRSDVGKGSSFTASFPAAKKDARASEACSQFIGVGEDGPGKTLAH